MLIAVGVCIYSISSQLQITNFFEFVNESKYAKIFFFEDISKGNYFWKQFLSGAFIAIVMTGLDQDMMQKNLTCRNLKDAKKNMFWFTIVLVIVNFFFLALGVLLTVFAQQQGINAKGDELFPVLATQSNLGTATALFFLLGLIAAAYSSADSALTSLTTSFSVDILEIDKKEASYPKENVRKKVHILFSILLIVCILLFKYLIKDTSVIASIFKAAGYTYGPLLGLYSFGLFTKSVIKDQNIPIVCILSPFITYFISYSSLSYFNFDFGFFVLILNGFLTFLGLSLLSLFSKDNALTE
jgi:Na+/proline symporter